jgi:hypothetical protein
MLAPVRPRLSAGDPAAQAHHPRPERGHLGVIRGHTLKAPRPWRFTKARAHPSSTNRTGDEITLDEVERIAI